MMLKYLFPLLLISSAALADSPAAKLEAANKVEQPFSKYVDKCFPEGKEFEELKKLISNDKRYEQFMLGETTLGIPKVIDLIFDKETGQVVGFSVEKNNFCVNFIAELDGIGPTFKDFIIAQKLREIHKPAKPSGD